MKIVKKNKNTENVESMSWNDLTERQKQLDRAIEGCGIKLDNSSRCLKKVMNAIGANDDESDFVQARIALRLHTQQLLDDTNGFIERTNRMLDRFEEDDKRWKI